MHIWNINKVLKIELKILKVLIYIYIFTAIKILLKQKHCL